MSDSYQLVSLPLCFSVSLSICFSVSLFVSLSLCLSISLCILDRLQNRKQQKITFLIVLKLRDLNHVWRNKCWSLFHFYSFFPLFYTGNFCRRGSKELQKSNKPKTFFMKKSEETKIRKRTFSFSFSFSFSFKATITFKVVAQLKPTSTCTSQVFLISARKRHFFALLLTFEYRL